MRAHWIIYYILYCTESYPKVRPLVPFICVIAIGIFPSIRIAHVIVILYMRCGICTTYNVCNIIFLLWPYAICFFFLLSSVASALTAWLSLYLNYSNTVLAPRGPLLVSIHPLMYANKSVEMEENNHKYCANNWYVTETHIGAHFYELIYKDQSQGNEAKRSVFVYAVARMASHSCVRRPCVSYWHGAAAAIYGIRVIY